MVGNPNGWRTGGRLVVAGIVTTVLVLGVLTGGAVAEPTAADSSQNISAQEAADDTEAPDPYLTNIDVPDSVTVGDSFTVDVSAKNYGGESDAYSTISVSAPTLDSADGGEQVDIVSDNFGGYTTVKSADQTIYDSDGNAMSAEYALAEAGTYEAGQWPEWEGRDLSVEFTPETTGTFEVYVRATMPDDESSETFNSPEYGSATDQQGYTVKRYEVEVREEPNIDAEIQDTSVSDGDYEDGDEVTTTVDVENTGNREHTFYVGYSVYDGDGTAYDNDGSTGKPVTLEPGADRSVDVDWTVQDGADAGLYDARVSVWQESDSDALRTRLADERANSAFSVREDPSIDATIESVDTDSGTVQPGDDVDTTTRITNTGNRQHTFFVGYSVYDASNTPYDNSDTTGTTVTLDPDESKTVDLGWRVPDDATVGAYDARVSVWKESDRDSLRTRLADSRQYDQFDVRPVREVKITVSKRSTKEAFEFAGEPITDATVRIDGRTLQTDADGSVSMELPVDSYSYTVSASGYETAEGRLRMSADSGLHLVSAPLVRDDVGEIEVDVLGEDGTAIGGNMYDIHVDGTERTPNANGQLLLSAGTHTVSVVPTSFGATEGVSRVDREVTITEGERTALDVTAIKPGHTLDISVPDDGGVRVDPPGVTTTEDFSRGYEAGTTVSVTAEPGPGQTFDGWEGDYPDGAQTRSSVELTIDGDTSVTPVFSSTGKNSVEWVKEPPQNFTDDSSFTVTVAGNSQSGDRYANVCVQSVCRSVSGDFTESFTLSGEEIAGPPNQNYTIQPKLVHTDRGVNYIPATGRDVYTSPARNVRKLSSVAKPETYPYTDTQSWGDTTAFNVTVNKEEIGENRYKINLIVESEDAINNIHGKMSPSSQILLFYDNEQMQMQTPVTSKVQGRTTELFVYEQIDRLTTVASLGKAAAVKELAKTLVEETVEATAKSYITDQLRFETPPDFSESESIRYAQIDFDTPDSAAGRIETFERYNMTFTATVEDGESTITVVPDLRARTNYMTGSVGGEIPTTEYRRQIDISLEADDVEPTPPNADMSIGADAISAGQSVSMDASDSADSDGEITTYQWDFDGDGTTDRLTSSSTVSHTYDTAGEYTVELTVVDEDGATDTTTQTVTVESADDGSSSALFATGFEGTATGDEPGGWVAHGNSAISVTDSVATAGDRSLRLTGSDGACWETVAFGDVGEDTVPDGTSSPSTDTVNISFDVRPMGQASAGCHGTRNTKMFLNTDNGATYGGDSRNLIEFDANGGVTAIAGENVDIGSYDVGTWTDVTITFQRDGDQVVLTYYVAGERRGQVTRDAKAYASELSYLQVNTGEYTTYLDDVEITPADAVGQANDPPTAAVSVASDAPTAGESVSFDAGAADDSDGSVTSYEWDFDGDGTTDRTTSSPTVSHTYGSAGDYALELTVVDDDGATATTTQSVTVESAAVTLHSNGFEQSSPGQVPDGWVAHGNSAIELTDGTAASGDQSLRLTGSDGGCWETAAFGSFGDDTIPDSTSTPSASAVNISFSVRPMGQAEPGCHGTRNTRVMLDTGNSPTYGEQDRRLIEFDANGDVTGLAGSNTDIGSYDVGTWTDVTITYRRDGEQVELTYYVDGENRGQVTRDAKDYASDLSHLQVNTGEYTTYLDDFHVRTAS